MDISQIQLTQTDTIRDAISIIERGHVQFAYVVDDDLLLIGTVTDGDVRRGLLDGYSLDAPVVSIMNTSYRFLSASATQDEAISLMHREALHQIPLLDDKGRVAKLFLLEELMKPITRSNPVVIMAGGEGKRLRPLTLDRPKPMLPVGGVPMLEIILKQCIDAGFTQFYLSVNYLKDHIKNYFGGGDDWGVNIQYLEEDQPLGTVGALSLLPEKPQEPVLVLNGDVLTRVNYGKLLNFHEENQASATMCVREHLTQIPFGVVHTNDVNVQSIVEKPTVNHLVNAGIYILNPKLLDLVPLGRYYDMPQLLQDAITHHYHIAAFPVHEYWLDLGQHETLEFAQQHWPQK